MKRDYRHPAVPIKCIRGIDRYAVLRGPLSFVPWNKDLRRDHAHAIVRGREPLIRLTIRGFRGRHQEIEAVIDSGYTGWLSLPPTVIAALNLRWRTFGRGILADGSLSSFDVYHAKVVWDGRARPVFVDEFDATPLVGMAMMRGYEYKMQVRARGKVTLKRLARK